MDKGRDYIKMCRQAREIQDYKYLQSRESSCGRYPWEDGDMFVLGAKVHMYDGCSHSEGFIEPEIYNPKCVWLPSQSQLQEMLYPARYKEKYDMCSAFAARCTFSVFNAFISDKPDVMSMEQLWLAFVMLELHQKRWYNGEWIDDTRNT